MLIHIKIKGFAKMKVCYCGKCDILLGYYPRKTGMMSNPDGSFSWGEKTEEEYQKEINKMHNDVSSIHYKGERPECINKDLKAWEMI